MPSRNDGLNGMRHVFFCIDGHTAGNPVRLVAAGGPFLRSTTMVDRRQEFLERYDWIRTGLCFEPRGHPVMSGGFIFSPTADDTDFGILFIETSGCLPMCGHGTIGIVTFALEHGLVHPRQEGKLRIEVPAGIVDVQYERRGDRVSSVRIRNVPGYVAEKDIVIDVPGFGSLTVDVAFGGNYYAIVEPQGPYTGLDDLGAAELIRLSRQVRELVRGKCQPVHPLHPTIKGVSHVLWADKADRDGADGRNAVFYGDGAIDRSPCGTGTCARMAHLAAQGRLKVGQKFGHDSYIHSRFTGRVEDTVKIGDYDAIVPSIEGSAVTTGHNTIWIDDEDEFAKGFLVD
jgi:4-hydroxyproline epimerase